MFDFSKETFIFLKKKGRIRNGNLYIISRRVQTYFSSFCCFVVFFSNEKENNNNQKMKKMIHYK
jgi:hypothetical protein